MCSIHKHVNGIDEPLNGNCFYRRAACVQGKPRKQARGPSHSSVHRRKRTNKKTPRILKDKSSWDHLHPIDDIHMPDALPGQYFHIDFGFVRGSNYTIKQENGPTITSKDGYNSYFLVIDRSTRYTWIF